MKLLSYLLLSSIGGGIGWWLGEFVGMGTAVVLSGIGTGVGVYYARKLARDMG
jgi:hypothetical protein